MNLRDRVQTIVNKSYEDERISRLALVCKETELAEVERLQALTYEDLPNFTAALIDLVETAEPNECMDEVFTYLDNEDVYTEIETFIDAGLLHCIGDKYKEHGLDVILKHTPALERDCGFKVKVKANLKPSVSIEVSDVTVLPDGSAFMVASAPLPKDHWLYEPREYPDWSAQPALIDVDQRAAVRTALQYAVKAATRDGQDLDFDPDALVLNALYALKGNSSKDTAEPNHCTLGLVATSQHETTLKTNIEQLDNLECIPDAGLGIIMSPHGVGGVLLNLLAHNMLVCNLKSVCLVRPELTSKAAVKYHACAASGLPYLKLKDIYTEHEGYKEAVALYDKLKDAYDVGLRTITSVGNLPTLEDVLDFLNDALPLGVAVIESLSIVGQVKPSDSTIEDTVVTLREWALRNKCFVWAVTRPLNDYDLFAVRPHCDLIVRHGGDYHKTGNISLTPIKPSAPTFDVNVGETFKRN